MAIVAAHYDDELLGVGGTLTSLPTVRLIHVTDSGHNSTKEFAAAGVDCTADYSTMRRREFAAALQAGGWPIESTRLYGYPSQPCMPIAQLPMLAAELAGDLAECDVVISHAYEGGHPDHDLIACALQLVRPPILRLEFTGYHERDGRRVVGQFWPDAASPEIACAIQGDAFDRKRRALNQYYSQRSIVRWFPSAIERFRAAPCYDFTAPPPPGTTLYDRYGWGLTGATWREGVRRAVEVAA